MAETAPAEPSTEQQLRDRFIDTTMTRDKLGSALKAVSAIVGQGESGGYYLSASEFGDILLQASED